MLKSCCTPPSVAAIASQLARSASATTATARAIRGCWHADPRNTSEKKSAYALPVAFPGPRVPAPTSPASVDDDASSAVVTFTSRKSETEPAARLAEYGEVSSSAADDPHLMRTLNSVSSRSSSAWCNSGRNSMGLFSSRSARTDARALKSITGLVSRLPSSDTARSLRHSFRSARRSRIWLLFALRWRSRVSRASEGNAASLLPFNDSVTIPGWSKSASGTDVNPASLRSIFATPPSRHALFKSPRTRTQPSLRATDVTCFSSKPRRIWYTESGTAASGPAPEEFCGRLSSTDRGLARADAKARRKDTGPAGPAGARLGAPPLFDPRGGFPDPPGGWSFESSASSRSASSPPPIRNDARLLVLPKLNIEPSKPPESVRLCRLSPAGDVDPDPLVLAAVSSTTSSTTATCPLVSKGSARSASNNRAKTSSARSSDSHSTRASCVSRRGGTPSDAATYPSKPTTSAKVSG